MGAVAWRGTDILSNKQAINRSSSLLAAGAALVNCCTGQLLLLPPGRGHGFWLHVDIPAVDSHQLVPITPMFPPLTSRCHLPRRPAPPPYMPDSMICLEYWPISSLINCPGGSP